MFKLLRDLLYDRENQHLDIARFSALLSVIGYVWMSAYFIVYKDVTDFDFLEWAAGWAALCGGNAAWIYARQRIEYKMDFTPMNPRSGGNDSSYGGYYGYAPDYTYSGGYRQDDETRR